MRIIIDGWAGAGKSTVARAVAEEFNLRHVSAGEKFRAIAKRLGYSTEGEEYLEFHKYQRSNPEIDKQVDEMVLEELRRSDCVVDARIAGHLFQGQAYRVLLKVPEEVAAERNARREGIAKQEALRAVKERNKEDAQRYKELYDINVNDVSPYDLVLDTSYFGISDMNEVVLFILGKLE